MITLKTNLEEVKNQIIKKEACKLAVDWCNFFIATNGNPTLGDVLKNGVSEAWLYWGLSHLDGEMDEEVRNEFLKEIKDPMFAFTLYTELKNISKEGEKILEKVFVGKLPDAELELKVGKVKRLKTNG